MDWNQVVREVLMEARQHLGGGTALARALDESGVRADAGPYSVSAVSNWIKGRTRPPAEVVLAAAATADLSLDDRLRPPGRDHTGDARVREELDELRHDFGRLEMLLLELYNRTGQPYPHERVRSSERAIGE